MPTLHKTSRLCSGLRAGRWLLSLVLILNPFSLPAQDPDPDEPPRIQIQLVMTGSNRAIVVLEGQRLVLTTKEKHASGVELVEANSEQAVVEIDGQEITLRTGEVAAPILPDSDNSELGNIADAGQPDKVTLWADDTGFFFARGQVGRNSARFLVDTGANTVTFSSRQADALGIEYQNGANAFASTASGIAPIKTIVLKKLTIEGISLRNIDANVVLGNFPEVPLLGGSFLNKLNMVRTGKKMELSRY
ncbi:MAG: retroviral-like aspartic protease family protein [Acidiferrobacterales bacterium]|nr:retroviral-like aspartic protease family protein [Acidiferrobacterales bacterium]